MEKPVRYPDQSLKKFKYEFLNKRIKHTKLCLQCWKLFRQQSSKGQVSYLFECRGSGFICVSGSGFRGNILHPDTGRSQSWMSSLEGWRLLCFGDLRKQTWNLLFWYKNGLRFICNTSTFGYEKETLVLAGSGSAVRTTYWLTDPDPALFFDGLQDAKKIRLYNVPVVDVFILQGTRTLHKFIIKLR